MSELRPNTQFSTYAVTVSAPPDSLLLVARAFLAAVFLYGGMAKLLGWQSAISEFDQLGAPLPSLAVAATVAVQLLA